MTWRISSLTICFMRTCPLIVGASPFTPGEGESLASRPWASTAFEPSAFRLCDYVHRKYINSAREKNPKDGFSMDFCWIEEEGGLFA
jgi:hypothetical protein